MEPLLSAFILVFGAVIGSFLNAVLWRLHAGESIVSGRSLCPSCRHSLHAKDLVPILSWLFLGGRCRYCRAGIGASYLAIEATVGLLFWLAAARDLGTGLVAPRDIARLLLDWYLIATLVVVFVYDLRHMLILRAVTAPATLIAGVGSLALGMPLTSLFGGMIVGGGFFYLQYTLSKGRWVGGGDIFLGILMGAMLGWSHTLAAIMLAYIAGALYASVLLLRGRKTMQSEIPFGTFLSAAAGAMLLYGDAILGWYLGML